jgi:DNA-binding MarR family transcriptional regulator
VKSDDRDSLRAWLALLSASSAIKKGVDARMRHLFGISISRFDVMAALDRVGEEGLTAGGLSDLLRVTEGNTTQVTAPLIEAGLVRRTPSMTDRRVAIFQLTPKGRRLFAQVAEENRRWIAGVFAGLTPAQVSTLRKLLGALRPPASLTDEEAA